MHSKKRYHRHRWLFWLLPITLVLNLTACGFKLRGQAQLPAAMAVTFIEYPTASTAQSSPLSAELSRLLRIHGVVVTETPENASARLVILAEQRRRRTLATGASGGVRENIFVYNVSFMVLDSSGTPLLPETQIGAQRDVLYDETQLLGLIEGERLAQQALVKEVAWSIVRRLENLNQ